MHKNVRRIGIVGICVVSLMTGCLPHKQSAVTVPPSFVPQTATSTVYTLRGERLAGESAPLVVFNEVDYQQALDAGKIIFLYFYADWCPVCKEEQPILHRAFDEYQKEGVVGFRVNYRDGNTDKIEENLARQFGVAYQHTKVVISNGAMILKSPETWDSDRYQRELNALQP